MHACIHTQSTEVVTAKVMEYIIDDVGVNECRVENVTYLSVDGRRQSVSAAADVSIATPTPSNARLTLTIGQ